MDTKKDPIQVQKLTKVQQSQVLIEIHRFLSEFDRIPGNLAAAFARVLDGIILVNNNIVQEIEGGTNSVTKVLGEKDDLPEDQKISAYLDRVVVLRRAEGLPTPSSSVLAGAKDWLKSLYNEVTRLGLGWYTPHVATDEEGHLSFEWWNKSKKLTISISLEESIRYATALKVWGPDMLEQMEDVVVESPEKRLEVWTWLWE